MEKIIFALTILILQTDIISTQETNFGCVPDVTAVSGGKTVTVPDGNKVIPPGFTCTYVISAQPNKAIKLVFGTFKFGDKDTCTNNYVEIGSGNDPEAKPGTKYCGSNAPQETTFNEQMIYVNVVTKTLPSGESFAFTATEVEYTIPEFACESKTYQSSDQIQNLTVPSSGTRLPEVFNCTYQIKAAEGRLLDMNFVQFKLGSSAKCDTGYVTISQNEQSSEEEQMKLCGQEMPDLPINKVPVVYVRITGSKLTADDGFTLAFKSAAGRLTPLGILVSMLYLTIFP